MKFLDMGIGAIIIDYTSGTNSLKNDSENIDHTARKMLKK